MNNLLFVVGVGRSGTSLLQSMLASNSLVCFLPETSFIRRYLSSGLLTKLYSSGGEKAVSEQLVSDALLARTGVDLHELLADLKEKRQFSDSRLYFRLSKLACDTNKEWIGDKDPRLVEFLPLVSSLAPAGAVVNVIRDPRDILLSKKNAAWSQNGHVWKHIFANRVQLKLGRVSGPTHFGKNYHEVIYEELIAEPESVLKRLCEDIGLHFDVAMLQFGDAAKKLVSDDELSWKKETFGPLLSNNKGKWKVGLSSRETALTELCCKQAFRIGHYQYDTRQQQLSLKDRIWVWSGATAIILLDWPYRLYRTFKVKRACKRMT
jgi:hypothetical protein